MGEDYLSCLLSAAAAAPIRTSGGAIPMGFSTLVSWNEALLRCGNHKKVSVRTAR